MKTNQFSIGISKESEIAKALYEMTVRRQGSLAEDALKVYVEDLKEYPLDDVIQACRSIGRAARNSGEKAVPDVGSIVAEVVRLGRMRNSVSKGCPHCSDGMIPIGNELGQMIAVKPCPSCGGPKWYQASLEHNRNLPIPRRVK